MAELQGIEKGIPLSSSVKDVLKEQVLLNGLQYEASQKMDGCTLSELAPVLENGVLIDDFFSACTDYIYGKSGWQDAAKSYCTKAEKEHF